MGFRVVQGEPIALGGGLRVLQGEPDYGNISLMDYRKHGLL